MIQDVLADAESRMKKAMDALRSHLNGIRTGRASPTLLDRVQVDYYGTPTPLNQLSSINVPEPRLLVIQPWDRGTIPAIERAILKSDLGLNPSNDGQVIRLAIPPLTEERRKQLVKLVHQNVEEAKIAVRNIRRDATGHLREFGSAGEISENDERRAEHQVDDLTKRFVEEADKIGKGKEHEVLEV
jgi:ribosome recycling factor